MLERPSDIFRPSKVHAIDVLGAFRPHAPMYAGCRVMSSTSQTKSSKYKDTLTSLEKWKWHNINNGAAQGRVIEVEF